MPWRNFLSLEFRKKVPQRSTLIFVDTLIFLKTVYNLKNQINQSIRVDGTPTCDGQTQERTGKQTDTGPSIASTRASIASRGQKLQKSWTGRMLYYSTKQTLKLAQLTLTFAPSSNDAVGTSGYGWTGQTDRLDVVVERQCTGEM